MKANPNIDELLCSFLDGELPVRQRTEVQRMAARDPEIGRRLRQLQNCKTLVSALPRAEAPGEMLERIKLAVERETLLEEQPVSGGSLAGARHLIARRLLATAAMIALLGVLGVVVYQIVAPIPGGNAERPMAGVVEPPRIQPDRPVTAPIVVADSGFSGRLEIRSAMAAQVDAVLTRAIEQNGLSALVESDEAADARIYKLAGSRQSVNRLVANLESIWPSFDAVTLHVEGRGRRVIPVSVEAVTPEQAASIVAQASTEASMEVARNCAVLNAVARNMPGREILAVVSDGAAIARDLVVIDDIVRPTGGRDATLTLPQGEPNVNLTIVLLRTK